MINNMDIGPFLCIYNTYLLMWSFVCKMNWDKVSKVNAHWSIWRFRIWATLAQRRAHPHIVRIFHLKIQLGPC